MDTIDTGTLVYNASRLTYLDPTSSLRFEIVHSEGGTAVFLSLTKYKFDPDGAVPIEIHIGDEKWVDHIPLLEGKMRLRFPSSLSDRIILALQEGKEVGIMLDGFEQHIDPNQFASLYEKLTGKTLIFRNPFKGLFEP